MIFVIALILLVVNYIEIIIKENQTIIYLQELIT